MTDLAELLERVKAATGPDRELDLDLMALAYVREKRFIGCTCWDDGADDVCCPGGRHLDDVWVDPRTDEWRSTHALEVTASLDAALALVERVLPGWRVQLFERDPEDGGGWNARLKQRSPWALIALDEVAPLPRTAPLALLAALLSALIAQAAETAVGSAQLNGETK